MTPVSVLMRGPPLRFESLQCTRRCRVQGEGGCGSQLVPSTTTQTRTMKTRGRPNPLTFPVSWKNWARLKRVRIGGEWLRSILSPNRLWMAVLCRPGAEWLPQPCGMLLCVYSSSPQHGYTVSASTRRKMLEQPALGTPAPVLHLPQLAMRLPPPTLLIGKLSRVVPHPACRCSAWHCMQRGGWMCWSCTPPS